MSQYCEETYTIYDERRVKARKTHRCMACGEPILQGHVYCRVGIVFDREAETVKRCLRCQTLHEHLRSSGDGETWPNEKLNCGHDYEEVHGEPPPENIVALAFMTSEEAQKSLSLPLMQERVLRTLADGEWHERDRVQLEASASPHAVSDMSSDFRRRDNRQLVEIRWRRDSKVGPVVEIRITEPGRERLISEQKAC